MKHNRYHDFEDPADQMPPGMYYEPEDFPPPRHANSFGLQHALEFVSGVWAAVQNGRTLAAAFVRHVGPWLSVTAFKTLIRKFCQGTRPRE